MRRLGYILEGLGVGILILGGIGAVVTGFWMIAQALRALQTYSVF